MEASLSKIHNLVMTLMVKVRANDPIRTYKGESNPFATTELYHPHGGLVAIFVGPDHRNLAIAAGINFQYGVFDICSGDGWETIDLATIPT